MPTNNQGVLDWEGLTRDLEQLNDAWVPTTPGNALNLSGIWRDLGYTDEMLQQDKRQVPPVQMSVNYNDDGTAWYEALFTTVPTWINNRILDFVSGEEMYERRKLDLSEERPWNQDSYARKRLEQLKKTNYDTDPNTFGENIDEGIQEGFNQFLTLMTGGRGETLRDKYDKIEFLGMSRMYDTGEITKEDYKKYLDWLKERNENAPLSKDIAAGMINSLFILGSLATTGGIVSFSTRGVKFLSKEGLKLWGKNMMKQGVQTWKLMGAGATVGSIGDTIDEYREMEKNGENPDFFDFMAELGVNSARKHSQAFLEGMSEGMIAGVSLGSVPLKKWLGTPIKRVVTNIAGETKERVVTYGVRDLKRLIKAATPEMKPVYQAALKQTLADRKFIAKQLSKNFGKSLVQGLGIETSTEQVTDIFNDVTEGTTTNALYIAFGDDKERKIAFRNLVVEAAVGLFLGTGFGMNEIWSRKPIEEIAEKYGEDVARQVEDDLSGATAEKRNKAIMKHVKKGSQKTEDQNKEENVAKVILDKGKGKQGPDDPEGPAGGAAGAIIMKKVVDTVEDLPNPNILDYVVEHGRQTLQNDFLKAAKQDPTMRFSVDSFLMDATQETVNGITGAMMRDQVKLASERGLIDRISWVKDNESQIKKDLAVGIALDFDTAGWGFIKHKYQTHDNIDFYIEEAKKLQDTNINLQVNDRVAKKLGTQNIESVKKAARLQYATSLRENIGLATSQIGSIIDAEVALKETEELFDEHSGDIKNAIVDVDVVKEDEGDYDISDLGDFLEEPEINAQTAPTLEELEAKAVNLANLISAKYIGNRTLAPGETTFVFESPKTGNKFEAGVQDLTYNNLIKQSIAARGGKPMHAVAFRDKVTGKIYSTGPGHTHPSLFNELYDLGLLEPDFEEHLNQDQIEDGFLDKQGKFYNREEAENATGFAGETATQGVNNNLDNALFETNIPPMSMDFPTYAGILKGFKGHTVRELVDFLTEKEHVNPVNAEVVAKLVEIVGDVELTLKSMDPKNPGVTIFDGRNILMVINPDAGLWSSTAVWDTLSHEMVHAFTRDFMESNTQAAATFNGKIKGVMNTVYEVLNAEPNSKTFESRWLGTYDELKTFKKQNGKLIQKAMSNEKEFVSSVVTDTQAIRWVTDRVNLGGPRTKATGWRRIFKAFQDALESVGIRRTATGEVFNILEREHKTIEAFLGKKNLRFNPKTAKESRRIAKQVTSGFEEVEYENNDTDDLLDPEQKLEEFEDEDENELENASIENFTRFMALAWGVPEPAFREYVKGLPDFESFIEDVNEMNEANKDVIDHKISHLYQQYQKTFKTVDKFKRAFLKRQYLNITRKNSYDSFIYMGIRDYDEETGERSFRYEIRKVNGSYRDGKGKKRNTYRQKIALEDYIPELELKLGLKPGTLKLGFLDGFESWEGSKVVKRSSLDRVDPYAFNLDPRTEGVPVTGQIADALWTAIDTNSSGSGMLYLGNFAGKNTLPILHFSAKDRAKVKAALTNYEKDYVAAALQEFKTEFDSGNKKNPLTPAREMSATARALLEDIWFQAEFQQQEDGSWTLPQGNSKVVTKDWNKTMKRGTKWNAADTGIELTAEEIEEEFGNAPVNGIQFIPGDAIANAAVISSSSDETVTFEAGGEMVTRKLRQLMQNQLGTSRIDGASFYIIGHFDKLYRLAHGALKSGALKNLYSSRFGDSPLFIKHAMHGVSASSPLGKFMLQHNLAVLVADESMKEGPQEKIIGGKELMDKELFKEKNPIIPLKLSQFTRIKEEENKSTEGGTTKQWINGSAASDVYNEIIKEVVDNLPGKPKDENGKELGFADILKRFTGRMTDNTVKWFEENSSQEALYNLLKDIVYNPKSPQEQSVSEMWIDYIEPREGQDYRDVLKKYGGFIHHAHTAETLRNRMQHKLSEMLGGKTAGMRGALDPNIGWFNYDKDIKPIVEEWNLADILTTVEDIPSDVAAAAFPEAGLRPIVQELLELNRKETRTHNQFDDKDAKQIALDEIDMTRQELIGKILELKSERLATKVKEGTTRISPHSLINWQDPKVKQWKDDYVWGREYKNQAGEIVRAENGILDHETGALREGWAIITEDIADNLGVKAGDWILLVVTPTDSAMGVIGVRVAGIAKSKEAKKGGRKVSDNNKITANSEWLQTLVGKDFDIDTISAVTYDERFWTKPEFEYLCKVANKVPEKYVQKMVQETKALFSEKGVTPKNADGVPIDVNKATVFQDEVRELYSILMNGTPKKNIKRRFSIMGASFIELDSAYLHDPAPIINERLMHSAMSAIGLKSKNVNVPFITKDGRLIYNYKKDGKAKTIAITFDPLHGQWTRVHGNHLHITNAEVDFPNKTTRLAFISDPKTKAYRVTMGGQFWGVGDQADFKVLLGLDFDPMLKLSNMDTIMKTLKGFNKFLLDDSFNLARRRNSDTFEKLDYITTIQQTRRAQRKLAALASQNKEALLQYVSQYMEQERRKVRRRMYEDTPKYKQAMLVIQQQVDFLKSYVQNMEIGDVYDYPLFATIRDIDVDGFPIPGNTYKDHLINQVLASKEALPYYPILQEAYDDAIGHAHQGGSDLYKVRPDVSYKPAYRILKLLGDSASDPVQAVRDLKKNPAHFEKLVKRLRPSALEDLKDAIKEFDELDKRAGKPFEPFERGGQLVNVDMEAIAMERMLQSLDYAEEATYRSEKGGVVTEVRANLSRKDPRQYWSRQLRGFRYEANTILHAFDEKRVTSKDGMVSESSQKIRHGHAATYPVLWEAMLESPFLFLNPNVRDLNLKKGKDEVLVTHHGDGILRFSFRGETFTHTQVNDEVSQNAADLKKLLTKRDGFWEGIGDNTFGTFNRAAIGRMVTLARNLTMERRTELLEKYLEDNLYNGSRGFTRDDQLAFWISMMAQVSDQGMLEKKGVGFIVNQTQYDKLKPFKFQTNHVALQLMGRLEPELTNMWMQFYSTAETVRDPRDRELINWAIKHGMDSDVEMLYQDVEEPNPDQMFRHFFSDYAKEHKELTKDLEFRKFFKKMRQAKTWKEGLAELRKLVEGVVMLKALSENGVFYEDLVKDLKTMTDAEFYKKYSKVDTSNIWVALERYMGEGYADEFIRQRAGESEAEFRTIGNIISTYYLLTGVKKREGARNKKLTFMRKLASNFISYDMVAILGEKQTRALEPKDEVVATVWDVMGPKTITTREAMNAIRTHATRTDLPLGESVIAITKAQNINRTLATHHIGLNNQVKRLEDTVQLLSGHGHRNKWRTLYSHRKEDKRLAKTDRNTFIKELIDQIPESADQVLEVRRQQVWDLAENLKKNFKVTVAERATDGGLVYSIRLGSKIYSYDSVKALVEKHLPKLKATQKLALLAALDIRVMYDIMVPKYLRQTITYLEAARDDLDNGANMDQALQINAMIQKYESMLAAIEAQKGNYMPHQFPIARYRDMWTRGYIDSAVKTIERNIKYHKEHKTGHPLGQLSIVKDKQKIREMALQHANKVWDQVSAGWNRGSIIPNFIPRRLPDATSYTKTDPTTHYNYNTKLMEGLKKDALLADWLTYQAKARAAGERHHIIELTRRWYADQIGDRTLRTKVTKQGDLKPGEQISMSQSSYILDPSSDIGYIGTTVVSGVVKKVTKDEIILNTDADNIVFEAKRDLDRWGNASTTMLIHGGEPKPSQRQWVTLQNLINKGLLTQEDFSMPLNKMDEIEAATLIIKGLERIVANPERVGHYKRKDVWGNDVTGKAVSNTVNRYVGHGAIEFLEAKRQLYKNLQLMGSSNYEGVFPKFMHGLWFTTARLSSGLVGAKKKLLGLFYMGMAAAGKARLTNQFGAVFNNIIDAPIYNYFGDKPVFRWFTNEGSRWSEGMQIYDRIKHGNLELMDEADQHLYKVLVGLGLTENNNILAIALEAANIKPEDMIVNDATPEAIRWLGKLFRDATKYDSTYKRLSALEHKYNLESDIYKQAKIKEEINDLKLKWEAKMYNLLKAGEEDGPLTNQREKELWAQLDAAAKSGRKINIAEEQGFTKAMAAKLFARVAWKKFYTSNLGMGFQAKAEKMRVPAFFIGYTTAIRMGFTPDEAIQLGVNSVELRHAFYGSANKQFGANTKLGTLAFQYAQYKYNALSKAVRILREMIPQLLKFKYNKPETVANWKHTMRLLKLIQVSTDAKGNELKRGQVTLKEINLLHGVLMKVLWTGIMMQVGTRIYYGLTNSQDPVGQVVYRSIDFIIDLILHGFDPDDEDDKENAAWMVQDLMIPMGLLYTLSLQAVTVAPDKGYEKTFIRGRVEDTFDFSWRTLNTVKDAAYELGWVEDPIEEDEPTYMDPTWLIDDFATGMKIWGWTAADNEPVEYEKRHFYGYDIDRSFGNGRYVETEGRGISGLGQGDALARPYFLFDPATYIPFLDRLQTGK